MVKKLSRPFHNLTELGIQTFRVEGPPRWGPVKMLGFLLRFLEAYGLE